MMADKPNNPFVQLAQDARKDFYMAKDGTYSDQQRAALLENLRDYRAAHPGRNGKLRPWEELANDIGISKSTLSELLGGRYEGDTDKQLRLVDQFIALSTERRGRLDGREFCNIGLARLMRGAVNTGIRNNSCPVILGPPGCGKSMFSRYLASTLESCLFIRIMETKGDARGVIELLYDQIPGRYRVDGHRVPTNRQRLAAVQTFLGRHRSTVIIVDEAQKLRAHGLELLRDLHDLSDLDARTNSPIVFFGDARFYRHLIGARDGRETVVAPQFVRRLHPVFDVEKDGAGGDGGDVYSVDDLARVLHNDRVKLVSSDGVRWLTMLANLRGYGMLGFAVSVAKNAYDVARRETITVEHLRQALELMVGGSTMKVMDGKSGGALLRVAG